ncbi:hypothetical protein GLAREA_09309 [Glarea lozoyensis ATCC 20868]|uniref:Uncharacterized protein n=1 Tax=Glarea lozoyensis (strain ATCC 20868 / MF5171) TaxID=1116229 RepID=S3DYY0_GLAL2|nr:uncharacterized protein GLAREA_09309 [Glarea lozoyensis ATCC 20868]EPE37146.1 hypothetical protein GLAREA_09309 [Glarea lozoyensis ATCC 20868]
MSCFSPRTPRKKPRLTIALFTLPQKGKYHYTFLLTPKPSSPPVSTRGDPANPTPLVKFSVEKREKGAGRGWDVRRGKEVKEVQWVFERGEIPDLEMAAGLHCLVTVGKVLDVLALEEILAEVEIEGEKGFDSEAWVGEAFERCRSRGVVTGKSGVSGREVRWRELEEEIGEFARRMGTRERDEVGWMGEEGVPCWDVLGGGVYAMS